jgi:hypothetical protein
MSMWKVFVSDVEVGEIPDNTFEMIRKSVRRDPRVWAETALDFIRPMRQLSAVFTIPPLVIVWVVLLSVLIDPNQFAQAMQIAVNEPDTFRRGIVNLLIYSIAFSVFGMVVRSVFTPSVFSAAYNRALGKNLRRLMKVPSDGEVRLERTVGSAQP